MKTSETINKIAPALLAAQRLIGNAAKNAKNPHFKNNYANLESVIEATKESLNNNGVVVIQTLSESEGSSLKLTTRLLHESGEYIEDTASTPLSKADPQGVGSAVTYLRRYSLAAICNITQEDDDGQASRIEKISSQQTSRLRLAEANINHKQIISKALAYYKISEIENLNSDQAETIIKKLI